MENADQVSVIKKVRKYLDGIAHGSAMSMYEAEMLLSDLDRAFGKDKK